MNVRYKILFSIEILNDYFSTGKWKEVSFIPLSETRRLIDTNGFQIRQVQNQLLVITQVDKDLIPLKLPDFFNKFSFVLLPQSPNYINFTNLPLSDSRLKCFHFHNLHDNIAGGVNYLSAKINNYLSTTPYKPGDFVKGADGEIYESIKINNNIQPPDNTIADSGEYWVLHGDSQFINNADTIFMEANIPYNLKYTGPLLNIETSVKRTVHHVSIYDCNFSTGLFNKQVLTSKVTFDTPHNIVQVDMRSLASGMYKVLVENDINYVYMVQSDNYVDVPVFIEIFNLPETYPQSLVKPDGTLKNVKYTLRFASRRVFWRYKIRTTTIDNIRDSSGDYTFKSDGLKYFISEKPIPLCDTSKKTLSANSGNLVITSPLPNPLPDRLLNKRDEIFTTEISVNY